MIIYEKTHLQTYPHRDFIMSRLKLRNHCSTAVSAVDMCAKYFIKWYQVQTVHLFCGKVDLFLQLSSSHVCLDAVHKVNDPCVNCWFVLCATVLSAHQTMEDMHAFSLTCQWPTELLPCSKQYTEVK